MLPRLLRINTSLFKEIVEKGGFSNGKFFLFRYIKDTGIPRLAVSVPKKVLKKAVDRNKIRRKVFSSIRKLISRVQDGYKIIIFTKSGVDKLSQDAILNEIESSFVKSGFLK
jgi:ribonuclease P protein component